MCAAAGWNVSWPRWLTWALMASSSICVTTLARSSVLALLTEAFLPHYQSPGHPETAAIDLVVARYQAEGVGYRPLRDGQALLINGPDTKIV